MPIYNLRCALITRAQVVYNGQYCMGAVELTVQECLIIAFNIAGYRMRHGGAMPAAYKADMKVM